LIAEYVKMLCI